MHLKSSAFQIGDRLGLPFNWSPATCLLADIDSILRAVSTLNQNIRSTTSFKSTRGCNCLFRQYATTSNYLAIGDRIADFFDFQVMRPCTSRLRPPLGATAVVYQYGRVAGYHIVRVERLRPSRQQHGMDHGLELGDGQDLRMPIIDECRR